MHKMKIEVGKFYKNKTGDKVRIYAVGCGGKFPIHGAFYNLGEWHSRTWKDNGKFFIDEIEAINDIVSEWEGRE